MKASQAQAIVDRLHRKDIEATVYDDYSPRPGCTTWGVVVDAYPAGRASSLVYYAAGLLDWPYAEVAALHVDPLGRGSIVY